jgi:hypothetical protein
MKLLCRAAVLASAISLVPISAYAEDLVFMLTNNTGVDLVEFYASPSDVGSWEETILGADVLASGESIRITIADGRAQCDYDLRMTFDDGDELEDTTDLCETGSYTIE